MLETTNYSIQIKTDNLYLHWFVGEWRSVWTEQTGFIYSRSPRLYQHKETALYAEFNQTKKNKKNNNTIIKK